MKTYPLGERGRRRDGTDSTDSRRYGAIRGLKIHFDVTSARHIATPGVNYDP